MAVPISHRVSAFARMKMWRISRPLICTRYILNSAESRIPCRTFVLHDVQFPSQPVPRRPLHTAARLLRDDQNPDLAATQRRRQGRDGKRPVDIVPKNTRVPRNIETMRNRMRKLHNLSADGSVDLTSTGYYDHVYVDIYDEDKPRGSSGSSTKAGSDRFEIQYSSAASPDGGEEEDFFGIRETVLNADRASTFKPSEDAFQEVNEVALDKKFKKILTTHSPKMDREKVIDLPYGIMRRDADNQPRKHGVIGAENDDRDGRLKQFPSRENSDLESEKPRSLRKKTKRENLEFNYFDEEYFGSLPETNNASTDPKEYTIDSSVNQLNSTSVSSTGLESAEKSSSNQHHHNFFDEQYFGAENSSQSEHIHDKHYSLKDNDETLSASAMSIPSIEKTGKEEEYKEKSLENHEQNFFDEQYFPDVIESRGVPEESSVPLESANVSPSPKFQGSDVVGNIKSSEERPKSETQTYENVEIEMPTDRLLSQDTEPTNTRRLPYSEGGGDPNPGENLHVGGPTKQRDRVKNKPKANTEDPSTAYDYAMKLRRGKTKNHNAGSSNEWDGAVDSKGFRILKNQVRDLDNIPQDVVVKILQDSILYENDDFIAIDKPYGLPSHGGPGIHHSVGKLASHLAERMEINQLELVHRLDKETTGIMLLAKTDDALFALRTYFKERKVIKRYWVITKGIPNPREGIIDIPMVESQVGQRYRMKLLPYKSEETSLLIKKQHSDLPRKDAVTNYKVLDSNFSAALVECQPDSGVKHQIRCHLAFGLNTPILGDHKYSHYSKMAPQKLPFDMLQRLNIRQPTARYVPMHLHAKELVLPQFYDGRNVFISSRLPKHFAQNMKWLKLKAPVGR